MNRAARLIAIVIAAIAFAAKIDRRSAAAQSAPISGGPVDPAIIEDLVAANRILAQEGILDTYGHVSIRHPNHPGRAT